MKVLLLAAAEEPTRVHLPEIDELIWGALAFFIFFLIIAKLAFPALRKTLAAREEGIRGELERAEQARLDAEEQREEYRRRLDEARSEADRVVREASETAEEIRRERISRAEEEARGIIDKARTDAGQERDRMLSELRREIASISLAAATRVVERELSDPESQRRLVEEFIERVGTGANGNGKGG